MSPTKRYDFSEPSSEGTGNPKGRLSDLDFGAWLDRVSPAPWRWDWPHLAHIRTYLDRVTAGEIDRLMIFCPPRHGKSEAVTVRYPMWRLGRDPSTRVIIGAYSQGLANRFSRKGRKIARDVGLALSKERSAAEEWETLEGGGLRAAGVGAGVTGLGGNLFVIDDPVKSREEAESLAYRDRVYEWYTDDFYTRREPGCAIILIQTRWHEDDLSGRLLKDAESGGDRWTVCNLPALAEEGDELGRAAGEALCPERYDEEELARIKGVQGPYAFGALYQQRPAPREGGMFKRSWFPKGLTPAIGAEVRRVRYWDKAGTEDGGDWTAGVLLAMDAKGVVTVENVVRGQWAAGKRDEVIAATAQADHAVYGGAVRIWIEQEPGSGGVDSSAATIRALAGYPARADRPSGDKVLRAEPFAAQAEIGNVRVVDAPWTSGYVEELCSFPSGAHDDQVDATSGAYRHLVSMNRRLEVT